MDAKFLKKDTMDARTRVERKLENKREDIKKIEEIKWSDGPHLMKMRALYNLQCCLMD